MSQMPPPPPGQPAPMGAGCPGGGGGICDIGVLLESVACSGPIMGRMPPKRYSFDRVRPAAAFAPTYSARLRTK